MNPLDGTDNEIGGINDKVVRAALRGANMVGIQQVCYDELLRSFAGKPVEPANVWVAVQATKNSLVRRLLEMRAETQIIERILLTIQPPE